MAKKQMAWKTKGMNRDLSVSAFNPEFAFENMNLRLSTNDGNTLLSWVNEKGPSKLLMYDNSDRNPRWVKDSVVLSGEYTNAVAETLPHDPDKPAYSTIEEAEADGWVWYEYKDLTINGSPVGTAVLNHTLVIFTHIEGASIDLIYTLSYNDDKSALLGAKLFSGDLNFSLEYPLETQVSYESESIQKVYWTDGRNQPRVINIAADADTITKWSTEDGYTKWFDFIPELQLEERVQVQKLLGASGMFAPGVIQYAFTYYNKNCQESNIFYTTPLYYISHRDRGASPEDKVENAFKITVANPDTHFDFLRIYSIQRTSINGTPIVKRIQDIALKGYVENPTGSITRIVTSVNPPTVYTEGRRIDPEIPNTQYSNGNFEDSINPGGIFGTSVQCCGYIKMSYPKLAIKTNDKTVTFGSNATKFSVIWITKEPIEILTEGGSIWCYCIVETPANTSLLENMQVASNTISGISYTDTGTSGETVDPTELLYKGGEVIIAGTMEQKDKTIFFGDIQTTNKSIMDAENLITAEGMVTLSGNNTRLIYPEEISKGNYSYANQLTAYSNTGKTISVPCSGFKRGDIYRCGVQLQDKYGRWSKPIWKDATWDIRVTGNPEEGYTRDESNHDIPEVTLPVIQGTLNSGVASALMNQGFVKIRPVVVFPSPIDRVVTCQGIVCPTMFTINQRNTGTTAQSSWFFRTKIEDALDSNKAVAPIGSGVLPYTNKVVGNSSTGGGYNPQASNNIRQVEIWGEYKHDTGNTPNDSNKFQIGNDYLTLHSPDIEFDDSLIVKSFIGTTYKGVGKCTVQKTLSDIDIQTETPTISSNSAGFVHKNFVGNYMFGIVSGLFYEDYPVDDDEGTGNLRSQGSADNNKKMYSPCKWMVHTWHKGGSLNNDINRPADKGTPSAILKKKVISNLRYAETDYTSVNWDSGGYTFGASPQIFSSDEPTILKFNGNEIYKGNIDTVLVPDDSDGMYFAFNNSQNNHTLKERNIVTPFTNDITWKTFPNSENSDGGYWELQAASGNARYWKQENNDDGPGEVYIDLVSKKDSVRMKYKSTPHLVIRKDNSWSFPTGFNFSTNYVLPIVDILNPSNNSRFGGTSFDALRENVWVPCGEPVRLVSNNTVSFEYSYGDTYFQRWDCLKTYAYTPEDINQVVEIGSFMLETHTNIDGRYDRNRGQQNNLNMSPRNFNLLNPIYSQIDNFFNYKIMPEEFYKENRYPNQITWSKTKESGADVDLWTNMTLASILELDGDKGTLNKLARFNNYLFAFQDTGISQILYNDNVQIASTEGVPIEIANSGKVQGKDYKSDTIGCSNKWSMVNTPNGIYFMDSNDKGIYLFNGQLTNISSLKGFNSWCKQNIPYGEQKWNPKFLTNSELSQFTAFYDKINQEVLFVNKDTALAWNEKLQSFTSFYDYGSTPFFCNLDDTGIWIRNPYTYIDEEEQPITVPTGLWRHQGGSYGNFFGVNKPYWMTLIGNPEPQLDKIFTNMEFRACVDGEGFPKPNGKFEPFLPFDSLEAWDEYQHGFTPLENKYGHNLFTHFTEDSSSLIRKFRIWRCDIPRDNACAQNMIPDYPEPPIDPTPEEEAEYEAQVAAAEAAFASMEIGKGIFRVKKHPMDRLRNPWIYITLMKNAAIEGNIQNRAEIHDLLMTYYG